LPKPTTLVATPLEEVLKRHKTKNQNSPKDKNALNPTIKGIFFVYHKFCIFVL
jgi:hypothetical protein